MYLPTTQKILAKWRGPSNSKEFNAFVSAVYDDIIGIGDAVNSYDQNLGIWNALARQEDAAIKRKINEVSDVFTNLNEDFSTIRTKTDRKMYYSYTSNENISFGGWLGYPIMTTSQQSELNMNYGQLVPRLAAAPVSKLHLYDVLEGAVVIPDNIVTLTPDSDTTGYQGNIIDESSFTNITDGNDGTTYYRIVQYTNQPSVGYEELTVEIRIPRDIVNNLQTNYVSVHPFPEYGIIVQEINLIMLNGAVVELLSTPITNAGKIRLVFVPKDIDKVIVVLRNDEPDLNYSPGKYTYFFGVNSIEVGNILFADTSKILTKFKLNNNKFRRVTEVGPEINGVTYSIWYEGTDLDLHGVALGEAMPIDTSAIWIETNLVVNEMTIPVAEYVYIKYTPWDVS